ncbi:MAG TPA: glycoside hydrolase family 127 protein [Firmicutes bacterium]|nr:glycoside hydrolase family 127 protein [Bacillota bacterium]
MEPKQVRIKDGFWSRYQELITNEVIPYQWRAMNDQIPDAPKSHAIKNLQIAGGSETGEFHGFIFQDSDVYKWLEAVAYSLMTHPDSELEQLADIVVEIIAKAQHPDGYINSYFTIAKPEARWTNLRDWHELYCAGHFFEAAAAYYQAVGNTQVLDTARKFVDYLLEVFGSNPEQIPGYPGHEEIELALVKLYQVTDDERYLQLSKFFIEERGRQPHFFDFESEQRDEKPAGDYRYWQAHLPVRKQTTAEGHAVRAVYLYTAVADIAYYTRDQELIETCFEVWQNVVRRRMYITGGIGASAHGESFSFDYDLPNDRAYSETCAAIGLIFWAQRMLKLIQNSEFADVMELALYNSALSGISLDGRRFFYVNPLEVWPEACHNRADQRHVKVTRQPWFGCACCPPNIARLLASLGSYIYTKTNEREIYTNLYIGGTAEIELGDQIILITQNSELPWNGKVKLTLRVAKPEQFTLALRIPGWCSAPKIAVNGEAVNLNTISDKGYAKITRVWVDGDTVDLDFPMETVLITANPKVRANSGKKAVMRGPLVYCLEEVDNGADLHNLILNANTKFDVSFDPNLLNGIAIISAEGVRELANWDDTLYRVNASLETQPVKLTFIPYYAWANRDPGEMLVWVRCR